MDWLLLAATGDVAATDSDATSMLMIIAVIVCVFVLPFALGAGLARLWRVRDMATKLGLVFFAAALGLAPFVWQYVTGAREQRNFQARLAAYETQHADWEKDGKAEGKPEPKEPRRPEPRTWKSAIKLGIDLRGGTNLVFQVEALPGKPITPEIMAQMVGAVSRRINPTGTEEVVVRSVGTDRIEVIVPGADPEEVARIKDLITRLGSLEFAILANQQDQAKIIEQAQNAKENLVQGGRIVAGWRDLGVDSSGESKEIGGPGASAREIDRDGKKVLQYLVIFEPEDRRVTGRYLTRAREIMDENGGLAVGFDFNSRGGQLFQSLTSRNLPRSDGTTRQLAILLDNKIHSAPSIQDTISNSGRITGRFSQEEITELIGVLNAGALEVPINPKPISEFSVGPLLAADVQTKGMNAVWVSSAIVVLFMLVYYRAAGIIADICLLLNIVLILGAMAYINATFTLPGIAGIVLTIGMAVDANVLIYERMREEQARGASLRMTISNGFDRALSAIIDSNVTSLITAAILYMIGTDQIKGFAVTLFIGLSASVFTAVFMGRVMFDLMERKRWLRSLNMMSVIHVPHINWLSKWKPAVGLSLALITVGFIALGARGVDNFDIDFTGGTMVTFELAKEEELNAVRKAVQSSDLGSTASVERLALLGQKTTGSDKGTRFRVRTKETNIENVRSLVEKSLRAANIEMRHVTVDPAKIVDLSSPDAKPAGLTEFPDGREVELTFSDGLKTTTAADYVVAALDKQVDAEGKKKHPDPRSLIAIEGLEKASTKDGIVDPDSFKSMRLMVSKDIPAAELTAALDSMKTRMATEPVFDEINSFDSQIASDMRDSALVAIFLSLVAIVGYLWFRFERVSWGIAGISALAHDVAVTLGAIPLAAYLSQTPIGPLLGLQDFKIDLGVVASLLTIIGFSINDTIVIFDRIREIRGKNPNLTADMLNTAVNQTMSRTILTATTVFIVVVIMYIFGGEGLHTFAFTLIVGVLSGTWSTIYMANPVLLWLMNRSDSPARPATTLAPTAKTAAAG